jgi:hypothetical protein
LRAHEPNSLTGRSSDRPSLVNSYSTRGYIQGADFMAVWKEGKELRDIAYLQAGVAKQSIFNCASGTGFRSKYSIERNPACTD